MSPSSIPSEPVRRTKVYLAAVGELMTEVAGEVATVFWSTLHDERYIARSRCRHWSAAGEIRARTKDFPISFSGWSRRATRMRSSPTRRERSGSNCLLRFDAGLSWRPRVARMGELQSELNAFPRRGVGEDGRTDRGRRAQCFSIVAEPKDVGGVVRARLNDVISRFSIYAPYALERRRSSSDRERASLVDDETRR